MKTLLVAAAVGLLGMSTAFAQGLPGGSQPPVYGTHAFPQQKYQSESVFSRMWGQFHEDHRTETVNRKQVSGTEKGS